MVGKPDAGAGAGRLCWRWRGLSVHPRRHSARCRPCRAVSGAGAAVYAVDRLLGARRGAERVAIYRLGDCGCRIPADTAELKVIPGPSEARSPESIFADLWLWIPDLPLA